MKRCYIVTLILFSLACPSSKPPVPPVPPNPTILGPTTIILTPNIGARDLLTMFAQPNLATWKRINFWKWYTQQLKSDDPCPACGPNRIPNIISVGAFSKLKTWGIQQSIEVAAIKEWGCSPSVTMPYTQGAIDAVNQNGGQVSEIDMDEPLYAGTTSNFLNPSTTQRCLLGVTKSESEINLYIAGMKASNSGLKVGGIEPYPALSASQIVQYIQSVRIDSFDIDPDTSRLPGTFAADLLRISNACHAKGIKFGVIFAGQPPPGLDFLTSQQQTIVRVAGVMTPDRSIFQSWTPGGTVPADLPETGATMLGNLLGATR